VGTHTYCHDAAEMRKQITAIAIAGPPVVLLDNLSGPFGNAALDCALTTTRWKDRVLGSSEQVDVPLEAVWLGTGNNVQVAADTARRIVHVRLDVLHERPEERGGFRHPDLLAWAARERPRLLVAALTIVSAYCHAGRPDMGLKPLGSYEGWSSLVRSAVAWAGLPDPCAARHRLEALADTEKDQLEGILAAFEAWDPHGYGIVLADLITALYPRDVERPQDDRSRQMRAALEDLVGGQGASVPTVKRVGNRLKHLRRRVSAGRYLGFDPQEKSRSGHVWRVHRVKDDRP
jgi:hypothetical protein